MKESTNNLEISPIERRKLRHAKIKIGSIHHTALSELQEILGVSKIRAMELSALSEFQSIPSIGIRFATDLIGLGYYSLKQLKGKNGATLVDTYEKQIGVWADPCVEDQFRLVVHYSNNPTAHKNWWDFTHERKAFREKNGYPENRPKKPWYELEKYRRPSNVDATKAETKKEVAARLRTSARYMDKHYGEKLSLEQLAKVSTISKHHFLRQFKNVYESTPIQYLTNIRLKNASRLLKTSRLSIAQVANQCGFENESSFIRIFRSVNSKTPLQFRKGSVGVS